MRRSVSGFLRLTAAWVALGLMLAPGAALAGRDAAFLDPGLSSGSSSGRSGDEAITVEPKSEIDTGESVVNVARRTTLFYVNQTSAPIDVESVTANGDGNVKSDVVSDDCSKGGKIAPASRCSIVVEVTPSSPGAWSVEVLLTHKGAGRIARAKLTGKASSQVAGEKKDNGLALNTKEAKPVEFGDIEAESGKAVRSALMINDSLDPITLLSIDVIAAENGLERLEQGCAIDMELKPGESCPVTLVWKPKAKGMISTDLIIRHTGKLGFAVIPIRGTAHANPNAVADAAKATVAAPTNAGSGPPDVRSPLAPTVDELEKMMGAKAPPISADMLPKNATGGGAKDGDAVFHLIGTVGNRVILLKPDGATGVVDIGEDIPYGDGRIAKITNVMAKGAEIFIDGQKHQLKLEAASALTSKAAAAAKENSAKAAASSSSSTSGGSLGGGVSPR